MQSLIKLFKRTTWQIYLSLSQMSLKINKDKTQRAI